MENVRKIVTVSDGSGNDIELEVLEEFKHKDKDYVLLYDENSCSCDDCECEEECSDDQIYIFEKQEVDGKENMLKSLITV